MNTASFKIKHITAILLVAAIFLISFNFFYVFPLFDDILLSSMENDGTQVANHVQRLFDKRLEGAQPSPSAMEQTLTDFGLKRVMFFSDSGQVTYSTQVADLGLVNKTSEFVDIVSHGKKSSRIVNFQQPTENGHKSVSISQTMVPIMENGRFAGAFGIERDISFYQNRLQKIKLLAIGMMISAAGGVLFFLWLIIRQTFSAEQELRRAHDQLTTAIDAIPDTFLVIDRNYRIVMANKAVRQVAGGDPVAKKLCCHQVSHHQDIPCTGNDDPCPLPLVLKHKKPVNILHTHYTATGEARWVDITASPIFDENGEVIQMIEACKDITRQKEAEQQLLQSKAELQEANRHLEDSIALANKLAIEADRANAAKSNFLANMSHEIRTPMNGVIGMTDLLLGTKPSPEQRDYLATIRSSSEALLTIINDILDFSKIEAGKLTLESIEFNPQALVEECSDILAMTAQKKGVEFICQIDSRVPTLVHGDPGRLRQVITNLAANATKFTNHGEVLIRVKPTEFLDQELMLLFEVSDTGIGMDPQIIPTLFEPFVQADASTTRSFGGTGLGLAICKQLVEMMGGQIGAKSRKGEGSFFWFSARFGLPVPAQAAGKRPSSQLQGLRALVVDDNASCRQWLIHSLTELGCQAVSATTKTEALTALHQAHQAEAPFHAVLLDADLPDGGGEQFRRQIMTDADCGGPRLVLMSPLGRPANAEHLRESGVSAQLDKPVKRKSLLTAMSAVQRGETSFTENQPPNEIQAIEALTASIRPGAKVLLAEDNLTNQKVAFGLLKKFGIEPLVVQNGQEAVQASQMDNFDLIFMDCQMPVMDGLLATATIRELEQGKQRHPIIAMTAHALTGDREKCLASGMDDYLSKPLSIKELAAVLIKWLGKTEQNGTDPDLLKGLSAQAEQAKTAIVLDRRDLLARLMNDEELAREVLAAFIIDMPDKIAALQAAVRDGDTVQIKNQGHTVKGAARNISAQALQETAWQIEMAGREGQISNASALLPLLSEQFQALAKEIREFIG